MDIPQTKYARSGPVHIAYQVFGKGTMDLVLVPGWVSHIEYAWEDPSYVHFLERLASFARVLWFDKRGTGLSDRVRGMPTLEERMDDVRAVMDAADFSKASLFGVSEGGSMTVLFAATYPSRTDALILYGAFAKRLWARDYPWAPKIEERQRWIDRLEAGWGGTVELDFLAPSAANDKRFAKWFAAYGRLSVSPGAAVALAKMNTHIDVRHVLPSIHVPTLVIHRLNDLDVHIGNARYMAKSIPGARLVELSGSDHLPWVADADAIVDEVEAFLTGVSPSVQSNNRVLATILFTDIVSSTENAGRLGDHEWRKTLIKHNEIVRGELHRFKGHEIKSTGDGFMASFDGPARAIKCACSIRDKVTQQLGLEMRLGLHTGECEVIENDMGGLAVHIASRVAGKAASGEVLVSSTVKDLVSGSGIEFSDRGLHVLKGVPGKWRLFHTG